ncbi:MAG TPA: DUF2948 family protein [Stellaceae bacterium]|jgi:hypothetical protein|nr:DUF2948 family protein [Stellaceae bacterium]
MQPDPALRLRAEDQEDLAVISACLQDALVAVTDLAYDPEAHNFLLVANRFRWECRPSADGSGVEFERILCALSFEGVESVAYRGFRRTEHERILSLLAIAQADTGKAIDLAFAGGVTIRLNAQEIRCRLRDFGEPWPTNWQPDHPLEDRP